MQGFYRFFRTDNSYLVFLKVFNKKSLNDYVITKLAFSEIPWSVFAEPDLDNQITAIALYDNGKNVEGLQLA